MRERPWLVTAELWRLRVQWILMPGYYLGIIAIKPGMIKMQDLRQTKKCTRQLFQSPQSFILKDDKNILCGDSLDFNDWGSISKDIMYHIISDTRSLSCPGHDSVRYQNIMIVFTARAQLHQTLVPRHPRLIESFCNLLSEHFCLFGNIKHKRWEARKDVNIQI